MIRVLLVCGSLQRASANRAALDVARATLSASGVEVSAFEDLGSIPPLNPDRGDDPGEAVLAFRAQLSAADAVLIAAPEYAGAIAGVVKNALDWIVGSGELYGKPVALLSAGASGGVFARRDLVRTLSWQGAHVVASLGIEAASTRSVSDADGSRRFTAPTTLDEIAALASSLVESVAQRPFERFAAVARLAREAGVEQGPSPITSPRRTRPGSGVNFGGARCAPVISIAAARTFADVAQKRNTFDLQRQRRTERCMTFERS